jgi:hypothetical protein
VADREGAEAAELDPITAHQRLRDLIEDGRDDPLDVAEVKMRIGLGEAFDQVGPGHRMLR